MLMNLPAIDSGLHANMITSSLTQKWEEEGGGGGGGERGCHPAVRQAEQLLHKECRCKHVRCCRLPARQRKGGGGQQSVLTKASLGKVLLKNHWAEPALVVKICLARAAGPGRLWYACSCCMTFQSAQQSSGCWPPPLDMDRTSSSWVRLASRK